MLSCDPKPDDDDPDNTSSGTSTTSTSGIESSSTTDSTPELGEPTPQGDPICAKYPSEDTCRSVEVAPSVFCKWQRAAFLPDGSATCEPLELSEGCFAYSDPSVDPTCPLPDECMPGMVDFQAPKGRQIDGGWLVVNSCGSTPMNGFDGCSVGESGPLACQCVCQLDE